MIHGNPSNGDICGGGGGGERGYHLIAMETPQNGDCWVGDDNKGVNHPTCLAMETPQNGDTY